MHIIEELARAHRLQPNLIGVNNRDLQRFVTNVAHTNEILSHAKQGVYYISESGIQHQSHVEKIQPSGIRGVLVGEALMKSESPRELIQSLKIQRG